MAMGGRCPGGERTPVERPLKRERLVPVQALKEGLRGCVIWARSLLPRLFTTPAWPFLLAVSIASVLG